MQRAASNISSIIFLVTILSSCAAQSKKPSSEIQSLINSANSGNTEAQFKLGSAYDYGQGITRDSNEALKWYLMAAEAGNAEAQNSVGSGYQAEKKYKLAYEWYKKAAKQNHALAINNLAYLYDLGLGVPQNRKKGYDLYLRAANLGLAEAMYNIGQMLGSGQLGEINIKKGCVWTIRALKYSKPGRVKEQANGTINYCKKKLTTSEYKNTELIANKWSPKT